jgi:hypothetical protein
MTRGIQTVAALIIAVASATDVPAQTNRRAIAGTAIQGSQRKNHMIII